MTVTIPDPPPQSNQRELEVMRKQTREFIAHNPVTITFSRGGIKIADGAGGYTTTVGTPIDPQTFRIIPQSGANATRNVDGEEVRPDYVLIGEWDADITMDDSFTLDGRNFDVVFIRLDRSYETWAEVMYRG